MKASVIIPAYNEQATLKEVIDRVKAVDIEKEIVVVDDGSTDGTRALLERMPDENVTVMRHQRNLGKGAAIGTGLGVATGDITVVQDADLEYDPAEYPKLIEPITAGQADAVFGSRVLGKARRGYLGYYVGGRVLTTIANMICGTRLTDLTTGHKVFRTDVLRNLGLRCQGFAFCAEVTAKLSRRGYRIHEVPISYGMGSECQQEINRKM